MARAFDWRGFLRENGVPFIERGSNVKRGELNVKCPFCGSADPSFHLGLNLETGWWACWRNRDGHSGKSPLRLIMRLLGVSYRRAREVAGLGEDYVDPEGFDAVAAKYLGRSLPERSEPSAPQVNPDRMFSMARDFVEITPGPLTGRWFDYVISRGFLPRDVPAVCGAYSLRAAVRGDWSGRLVLPYIVAGRVVTWTARAIGESKHRYLDLGRELSSEQPKDTLYNCAAAEAGGKGLVLVEGPVDALKLDFYGEPSGVRSVALSTNSISDAQLYLLGELSAGFEWVGVMMDNKTDLGFVDSVRMRQNLASLPVPVRTLQVPAGRGDPGALTASEARRWATSIAEGGTE